MKCLSCEVEINPKWRHAIDMNICPFCGQSIMEENLKKLLSSLNEVMGELKEYKEQVDDWMLSNHNYIKTDDPNIKLYLPKGYEYEIKQAALTEYISMKNQEKSIDKKYTVKVETETGEEDVAVEKIQSDEKTNEFFKRAEAVRPKIDGFKSTTEKTQHLKSMVQQIKRGGVHAVGGVGQDFITPDMIEHADPDEVAEMQSLISGGEINSSLPDIGGDEDIPPAVLAMAGMGSNNSGKSAADLLKLQQMHDRMKNSRANFESGANRGGKGGGFSRAG